MYRHKRRSIINLTLLSCICIISVTLSACTSGGVSAGADSPVLETCRLQGRCSGGENDQSITAALTFDRAVAFDEGLADQLRIVIGGQRIFLSGKTERTESRLRFPSFRSTTG
mgnify:CR=1 FL=1